MIAAPKRRSRAVLGALAALLTLATAPLQAQHVTAMRVGVAQAAPATSPPRLTLDVTRPARRWPYIVTGAVLGAAATVAVLANQIEKSDDPPIGLSPAVVTVAVASGATVGALGGWAVSSLVRAIRD